MSTWEAAFAAARHFETVGDWSAALEGYQNLYHNGCSEDSAVVSRYGLALLQLGALQDAESILTEALSMEPDNEHLRERLTLLRGTPGLTVHAAKLTSGLGIAPPSASPERTTAGNGDTTGPASVGTAVDYSALAHGHRRSGQRWQEIKALEAGLQLHGGSAAWQIRLGEARQAMNQFEQAAKAYGEANRLNPSRADVHFREGYCRSRAGDSEAAEALFAKAVALDNKLGAGSFGVGVFYQQVGDWAEAASAYTRELALQPQNAALSYRAALALEKCYEWEASAEKYRQATALDPTKTSWHYRRGFVDERLGRWAEAAEAYALGLAGSSKPSPYWSYRRGFVLERMGRYEEACQAHLAAIPELDNNGASLGSQPKASGHAENYIADALAMALRDPSPQVSFTLAEEAESMGLYRHASTAYQAAIDRSNEVRGDWYYRLGKTLTLAEDFRAAAASFRMSRVFDDAHGVDTTDYRKDRGLLNVMHYTSWRESVPLREDVILYESFHGDSISCNPLAIFEEVSRRDEFDDFLHVWVANDNAYIPNAVKTRRNVAIIRRNSGGYRRYLATAKYLINNVTFPEYFSARPGQQYLNTWHGTPLKTLGKDIGTGFLEHKNVARNFLHATHILAGNQFTAEVLTRRYDVDTMISGSVAVTGYPRVDRTLTASDAKRTMLKRILGIHSSDTRPVVLYAPTWRGGLSTTHFDTERLVSDLDRLTALNCNVIFRAHHKTQELLAGADLSVAIAPDSIETNELLAVVDVLITDYSSIVFDFLPTGKPVTMYTYDLEEYKRERGLYIDPSTLGLPTASTIDELVETVSRQITNDGQDGIHADLVEKYCPREDGRASARAVDFFFFGDNSHKLTTDAPAKKSLLFHHSFIPNGITSSLLNLLNHIDHEEYDVTVVVPVNDTAAHPERLEQFEKVPPYVRVIGRVGRQLFTPEEKWIVDRLSKHRILSNDEQMKIYRRTFEREFVRIFGQHKFTSAIEFEGYSPFWTAIISAAPKPSRRIVFLHNDMRSEWLSKHPQLEVSFRLYPSYDALVSVSQAVSEENREHLGSFLSLGDRKFVHAVNQINPSKTLELADGDLDQDLLDWFSPNFKTFITMGRMSPEKDHEKLVRAFHEFRKGSPTSRLVILGDGPLRPALDRLIANLELTENVLLAGMRSNPFPALARADCFVLSSNHEGQPMVLLEALTLKKPIISTDIIGAKYVLQDGYGLLVENSVEGLTKGLTTYADGGVPQRVFDISKYQQEAHAQFVASALPSEDDLEVSASAIVPVALTTTA